MCFCGGRDAGHVVSLSLTLRLAATHLIRKDPARMYFSILYQLWRAAVALLLIPMGFFSVPLSLDELRRFSLTPHLCLLAFIICQPLKTTPGTLQGAVILSFLLKVSPQAFTPIWIYSPLRKPLHPDPCGTHSNSLPSTSLSFCKRRNFLTPKLDR